MQFLNPAFLWLAAAIAVPIIVHLFNFRRPKRILFSNLAFVREVTKVVQRRLKLKQWLLLSMRILAIMGLVFAFADPVIPNKNATPGTQSAQSVVVVIDNSFSTSAADEKGVLLEQAKILAKEIVRAHRPTDEFQVLATGGGRFVGSFIPQRQALERIDEITYRNKSYSYLDALSALPYFFTNARHPGKTFYFLSDFQTSVVLQDREKRPELPADIAVKFLALGGRNESNLYISDVQFGGALLEKDKPAELRFNVNNDGDRELKNVSVKLTVDGKPAATATLNLRPKEKIQSSLTFTPSATGKRSGVLSVEDSPVEFDNPRYFSYFIPENAKILIVTGEEDAGYLRLFYQNLVSQYRIVSIDQKSLATAELSEYSAVVLAGVSDISSGMGEKLKSYIENGGGALYFPAEKAANANVNSFLASVGGGSYGELLRPVPPVQAIAPDLTHPVFQSVFLSTGKNAEFDGPTLQKYFTYTPGTTGVQSTILKDRDGRALVHETRVGGGTLINFAFYPSLTWSDFPLKSSFAPLMFRSTLLLTNQTRTQAAYAVGEGAPKFVKTPSNSPIKLRAADGRESVPEQSPRAGGYVLRFDRAELDAGNYTLAQGDTVLENVSFNYPDAESQLAHPTVPELQSYLAERGLEQITVLKAAPESVRKEVSERTTGSPLWKYFLLLAVAALFVEVAILKFMK